VKKILVIGATSAIAEQCCRVWAARHDALFLAARNTDKLETMATDLRVRGADRVAVRRFDATDTDDQYLQIINAAEVELGGLDIVLIAHGTLANEQDCRTDTLMAMQEIQINALSVLSILVPLANHFEGKGSGTIAVISSVAGDRGRASNYLYGSAKALVTTFTAGLRQRLANRGVHVLTIKPGFVDTPMTASFPKGFLWVSPSSVARSILHAIDVKQDILYVPWFWRYIMFVIRSIPEWLFKKLRL
jgi:decaprenylphospho-beta-D-erythro-pentofuranosid-2-ulose 2-reductase